jgi:hypothetical protein
VSWPPGRLLECGSVMGSDDVDSDDVDSDDVDSDDVGSVRE